MIEIYQSRDISLVNNNYEGGTVCDCGEPSCFVLKIGEFEKSICSECLANLGVMIIQALK